VVELASNNHLLQQSDMFQAIGLAAVIVVLGIFMPDVLDALQNFLLTLLQRATLVLDSIQTPNQSADMFRIMQR